MLYYFVRRIESGYKFLNTYFEINYNAGRFLNAYREFIYNAGSLLASSRKGYRPAADFQTHTQILFIIPEANKLPLARATATCSRRASPCRAIFEYIQQNPIIKIYYNL